MKAAIRKFVFRTFRQWLQYHAYSHAPVAGFDGYYELFGVVIAFEAAETDRASRYTYFTW